MERARRLLRSSIIVIFLLGLGKITGLIRTRLVSAEFGTSSEFDAFTAANQLPEVFVTLISGGALAAAFIPVYSAYLTSKEERQGALLANSIINLVIVVLGSISILGILFAPWITRNLLVPNFPTELQMLTASIMRIILLQTTLFGISGILSSILNAHQHFALPALAPVALDIGYIIGLVFFVPQIGIIGLAWGTVVGGILHILIQVPALLHYGFRYFLTIALRMTGVREVIHLMKWRVVTLGSVQFADLFIIRLTSGLVSGSTAGYFFGYYLMQLPETLIGTAIAIVVFPTMAELYNSGDIEGLKQTSMNALRIIWTLALPAAAALILLGQPAITLFLEQGAFTSQSTEIVYSVLVFFSFRVFSESSLEILARLFYAQHDTRTPAIVAIAWLLISVVTAFLLVDVMDVRGLALASTIAFTVQSVILFILNRRRLGYLFEKELLLSAGRSLLGVVGMSVIIIIIRQFFTSPLAVLVLGGTFGLVAYFFISYMAGSREIPALINLVRKQEV